MYYHYPSNNYCYITSVDADGILTFYKNNKPIYVNGGLLHINADECMTMNIKNNEIVGILITSADNIKPNGIYSDTIKTLEKTIQSHVKFFNSTSLSFVNINFKSKSLNEIVSCAMKKPFIYEEYGVIVSID